MVSTEIIKNWGGQNGGAENNFGGGFCPPLPPLAPPLPTYSSILLILARNHLSLPERLSLIQVSLANDRNCPLITRVYCLTNDKQTLLKPSQNLLRTKENGCGWCTPHKHNVNNIIYNFNERPPTRLLSYIYNSIFLIFFSAENNPKM